MDYHAHSLIVPSGANLNAEYPNPIIALLSLTKTQRPSRLILSQHCDPQWGEVVWRICQDAKMNPATLLLLLTDIIKYNATVSFRHKQFALILNCTLNAIKLIQEDIPALLLPPLSRALCSVEAKILEKAERSDEHTVITLSRITQISRLLQGMASARIISSQSQRKVLSCSKGNLFSHMARGFMPMYIG